MKYICHNCREKFDKPVEYKENNNGTTLKCPHCLSIKIHFRKAGRGLSQEYKHDAGKLELSLVPPAIIEAVGEVRMYGNQKYGDTDSWLKVEPKRYKDALMRHLCEYLRNDKSVDEESGIEHLKHIACNVAFLLEMERRKNANHTMATGD